MTRAVMWVLLAVVAGAAAVLSFSALRDLAVLCGFTPGLAWLLPVVVDAGAAAGCLVWLRPTAGLPHLPAPARSAIFARSLTWVLLASSVAGNAVVHGLTAYQLAAPWWLVVAVSAVAPAVLGAVVHLAVLVGRGTQDLRTPEPVIAQPATVPIGNTVEDRAAELIESGAGRRVLARELGVSEHQARQLLSHRANGVAR